MTTKIGILNLKRIYFHISIRLQGIHKIKGSPKDFEWNALRSEINQGWNLRIC